MNRDNLRTSELVEYNVTDDGEVGYQFVLEVTDTDSEDDSRESVFSIQAETTVSAKDSSDISTNEDSDKYFSEYELASSSDGWLHPWSFDRNISSESSPHQPDVDMVVRVCCTSEEDSYSNNDAGCIESECGSDSDISVVSCRFEYCAMCSSINDNPSFQFCHSCYQIKKTFFPEKPVAKRKRKRNTEGSLGDRRAKKPKLLGADEEKVVLSGGDGSSPETRSGIGGGDSGFESLNSQNSIQSGDSQPDDASSSSSTTPIMVSVAPVSGSKDSDVDHDDKCLTCLRNSTNALFLHGKTGHRCCCYECAKRVWFESRRCPICRSKVSNIIRILNT